MRFQQTSGMVMAKGVEDTAFFRYTRLGTLTEVGADPTEFAVAPEEFHTRMARRQAELPLSMTTLSTHDTKRSEDTRARISVLAELAPEWQASLQRLQTLAPLPDGPLANLLWQAVAGVWPADRDRLQSYAQKAAREAGNSTNWIDPDEAHEGRMRAFVRSLYSNQEFLEDFEPFAARVARIGEHASLGALLLRLTSPGLPDLYQGDALWSLNLVDPDNRRPVDWATHVSVLREPAPTRRTLKAHLTRRVLHLRTQRPAAFAGEYESLDLGPDRVGFVRGGAIRVVVPLRPGDRAGGGDQDLLPEYDQELTILD
jgi:(1->4)-alpha-D-glucan 1-alpha-D-glucosylmutase